MLGAAAGEGALLLVAGPEPSEEGALLAAQSRQEMCLESGLRARSQKSINSISRDLAAV